MGPPLKKVVRVFVSSTFRDFVKERDVLGKVVFPRLRQFCSARGLSLTEVDLRWGVTEEMLQKGETITTCLNEVTLCSPFFIGLLGERYGWHMPPSEAGHDDSKIGKFKQSSQNDVLLTQALDAAQKQFPFVAGFRDRSVTELEVRHALLNAEKVGNEKAKSCMFFYVRDPAMVMHVAETEKTLYMPESDHAKVRQTILKNDVKASGCSVLENYLDLDQLGERIYSDLCRAISSYFPGLEGLSEFERRRETHLAHAAILSNFFAGRKNAFAKLATHVSGSVTYEKTKPLVVVSDPGLGKSATVASWLKDFDHVQKKKPYAPQLKHVLHFVAYDAEGFDYGDALTQIVAELNAIEPAETAATTDFENNATFAFKSMIKNFKQPLLLIIDGLDKIQNIEELKWLPTDFPPHIRVILTTNRGPGEFAVKQLKWPKIYLDNLTVPEREDFISSYFSMYGKRLTPEQVHSVVHSENAGHPLFLKSLCNELRLFGDYFKLNHILEYYVQAKSLQDLYGKIFLRWEKDYCSSRPGLLEETFALISASYSGLNEPDLRELLGVTSSVWSPLFLAMQESLEEQGGLLNFSHFLIGQAALNFYPMDEEKAKTVRKKIIGFFKNHNVDDRKVIELPYQFFKLEDKESLKNEIVKLDQFVRWFKFDRLSLYSFLGFVAGKEKGFLQTWKKARKSRGIFTGQLLSQLESDTESREKPTSAYADKLWCAITCLSNLSQYSGLETLYLLLLEQYKVLYGPKSRQCGVTYSYLGKHIIRNAAWDENNKIDLYKKAIEYLGLGIEILERFALHAQSLILLGYSLSLVGMEEHNEQETAKGKDYIQQGITIYDQLGSSVGDLEMRNRSLVYIADSFGWFSGEMGTKVLANFLAVNERTPLLQIEGIALKKWSHTFYTRKFDSDEMFRQNCLIKSIKSAHFQRLVELGDKLRQKQREYDECEKAAAINDLEAKVQKLTLTHDGIAKFVIANSNDTSSKAVAAVGKLEAAKQVLEEQRAQLDTLKKECDQWREHENAKVEVAGFRESIGLTKEEARLQPLKRQTGLYSGMTGKQFEMAALKVMEEFVFPGLRAREAELADAKATPFVLLSNLTMGTSFEIDQLVILPSENPETEPCHVLALVEVKRNVNDVAKSFMQLQNVLSWCSGARERYDGQAYKNKSNPSGHFEKPIYHEEDGQKFMFTKDSFNRFTVNAEFNYFIDRVYYITRPRVMRGMNSGEESKIAHRFATDYTIATDIDHMSNEQLEALYKLIRKEISPFQAADLIKMYMKNPDWADQFVLAIPVQIANSSSSVTDFDTPGGRVRSADD